MKLIQKLITNEDAAGGAVGAGAIAAAHTPLFAQLSKRELPIKIKIEKKPKKVKVKQDKVNIKESFHKLSETDDAHRRGLDTFDSTAVVSKLKSLENKDRTDRHNSQAFVLEDDDGRAVKVWVRAEQAASFEAALNAFLADHERDERGMGAPEIAEILFKLKDQYDIIDVQWPEVAEDEEQEVGLVDDTEGGEGLEGDMPEDEMAMADDAGMGGGEEDAKSLLVQVIDMMKADAEARRAEAHARAAEAKAKEADLAREQIQSKVKQEERILDMESQEKAQKEAEKEAKKLAKLAKWQHDMERDEGEYFEPNELGLENQPQRDRAREEEERSGRFAQPDKLQAQPPTRKKAISGRVNPADVASFILNRVK